MKSDPLNIRRSTDLSAFWLKRTGDRGRSGQIAAAKNYAHLRIIVGALPVGTTYLGRKDASAKANATEKEKHEDVGILGKTLGLCGVIGTTGSVGLGQNWDHASKVRDRNARQLVVKRERMDASAKANATGIGRRERLGSLRKIRIIHVMHVMHRREISAGRVNKT